MDLSKVNTPAYVIDESVLENNLKIFKSIETATGCRVLLATKAFSMYTVYPLISKYLSGTTNSSYHEAKLSSEEFGKSTHIYAPAFDPDTFKKACKICDTISFNSLSEWHRYRDLIPKTTKIGLRLNPQHVEVSHKMYSPCQPGSRFGVLKKHLQDDDISGVDGVLIHALCGNNEDSLERLIVAIEDQFSDTISKDHIKWVNLGGGHMITRKGYDVDKCCELINRFQDKYNVQIILEPGESVVLNAGVLVCKVLDIVENSMDIAIIDTSAAAHMPDVIEMPYVPELKGASKENRENSHRYRLGGNTCLSGDIIGEYSFDAPLNIGDKLVFEDMAQYTMVKNTTFNGVNLPSIYIYKQDGVLELVKSFGFDDFKRRV
ncbi:carboxynorspermidine decarboxylase [Candidatus Marinamargulisbacteria bacterium SCGC AAA071-K20]|nr:carboxynorspermidine decarboxylase [Candidatus Marinamargulisbacteria bacterium SCGC AAA071-K20]